MNEILNIRQRQVVIGTVLGGSSLLKPPKGKNYYLAMRSCNELWLRYKMEELPGMFPNVKLYKSDNTYRCYSMCSPELTSIHNLMFSDNQRVVSTDLLDRLLLRDICLSVWYLDGGGKTGRNRKNAYLNTTIYGEYGSAEICNYFNILECDCHVNKNKDRRRIVFSIRGTERLFKTIANLFPEFMYCRL